MIFPHRKKSRRKENCGVTCRYSCFPIRSSASSIGYGICACFLLAVFQSPAFGNDKIDAESMTANKSTYTLSLPSPSINNSTMDCSTADDLLIEFGLDDDISVENLTNKICSRLRELQETSPTHECNNHRMTRTSRGVYMPTTAERYGYGSIAIGIISAVPLVAFFNIPPPNSPRYHYFMQTIIALATATLLADTFIHLIPTTLEAKVPNFSSKVTVSSRLVKEILAIISIYILYLVEMLIGTRNRLKHEHDEESKKHNHEKMMKRRSRRMVAADTAKPQMRLRSFSDSYVDFQTGPCTPKRRRMHAKKAVIMVDGPTKRLQRASLEYARGVFIECIPKKHFGWMVLLGDTIHNVVDGIAIGAAFSNSPVSGLSTSIAVLFQEVPHEIGDFVALMTAGVTWRGAMIWHCVSTVIAFISLFIGIGVSTDNNARQWVFALTTGIFLHHALSEFLPELQHIHDKFWLHFFLQNVGMFIGFGAVVIISIFEDPLHYSVSRMWLDNSTATGH